MLGKLKGFILKNTALGKSRYLKFLYRYDKQRYMAHSCIEKDDGATIATNIRITVHALEKGLSVAKAQSDFGKAKVQELLQLMGQYRLCKQQPDSQVLELAESILYQYRTFRMENALDVSFLPENLNATLPAGATDYTPERLADFERIAQMRHSIRCFGKSEVDDDVLVHAVELAKTAPSACNRQPIRVYACKSKEKIKAITDRHGGMRGFDNIGAILAVTGDLNLYSNEYERNTVFIDGGIFLMNLLYSLQSTGLGACPIIWGAEPDNDKFLYQLLNIPENEEILALVAVGTFPEGSVKIPVSEKRNTSNIIHIIK